MSNIVSLVKKLVPEFYAEEYPQLIVFLEAYYEFLKTQTYTGKTGGVRDIDDTVDLFVEQLKKELGQALPLDSNLPTRELLRNAKAFYAAKGTEASYRFLFRALFGTEASIFYPSSVILRASDGRWQQDTEIQVTILSGNAFDLAGHRLTIEQGAIDIQVFVQRVKLISGSTYALTIDRNYSGTIQVASPVLNEEFGITGSILPVLSGVKVKTNATGYQPGQIFDVVDGGTGAKFRVTSTNSDASLRKVELVKFGSGYSADFDSTIAGGAALSFSIGAVSRYPGYFSSSNGFLSDAMRLQDNEYYQLYSYVIKTDQSIDKYRDLLKRLVHPTGWALFGEFELTNDIQIGTAILEMARLLIQSMQDDVLAEDSVALFSTTKPETDIVIASDAKTFSVAKYLNDAAAVVEYGAIVREAASDYAIDYFLETGAAQYSMGEASEIRTW